MLKTNFSCQQGNQVKDSTFEADFMVNFIVHLFAQLVKCLHFNLKIMLAHPAYYSH